MVKLAPYTELYANVPNKLLQREIIVVLHLPSTEIPATIKIANFISVAVILVLYILKLSDQLIIMTPPVALFFTITEFERRKIILPVISQ